MLSSSVQNTCNDISKSDAVCVLSFFEHWIPNVRIRIWVSGLATHFCLCVKKTTLLQQTNQLFASVHDDFRQNVYVFENLNKKHSRGKLCNLSVLVLSCRQASHMLGRHCWMELISVSIRGGLWVEIC